MLHYSTVGQKHTLTLALGSGIMLSMSFALTEKKNHLAIHCIFDTRERAELFLSETVPLYITRGYYQNKALRTEDFEIIECLFSKEC